ncbi:MAG: hypothetical protein VX865_05350 [Candidatus Thermoplasmatota archaeon]|nr:hypothetical protein [Candidatus Thermoplasmatota archaeon]MED5274383.1 hypothetical protein [Candidatus Thermoplasmatota archaeon]
MTLDALAAEIASQAKAEAKSIIDAAKAEAKRIEDDARQQAAAAASEAEMRASRDSEQLSVEVVASARQANQKRALIARREELDLTWASVMEQVGSSDFKGRSDMIASLLEEADGADSDMVLRPVTTDRKALSSSKFSLGEDIEGLGGFVLESKDGSMVLDYRFDSRLEDAWKASLGAVNAALFGE